MSGKGKPRGKAGRPFTPAEDAYIRENYESSRTQDVAAALGRHRESVRGRARRLGLVNACQVSRREIRAAVRHDYFSQIDSPVKAYILGLLASDGTIASAHNKVGIKAKLADADVVKFVRDELSPRSQIGEYVLPPLPGYAAERPYVMFSVGSAQMKADLARFGIVPRKSLIVTYPELPPHLENNFILGCYDGDGCLQAEGRPADWRWELYSASEIFLVAAREAIRRHTGFELLKGVSRRGLHQLRLNGGRSVQVLDSWVHADVAGLDRKRLAPGAYDRAEQAVADRRKEAGRKRALAVYPAERREQVRQLRSLGLSLDRIVAETGVSRSVVHRWIKQAAPEATA
jgi:hypothetical protein